MIFEKAIEDAATMFLFDTRSQRQLQEMADEASPRSKDRFLIRLTQAAFTYYNDYEAQGWDIRSSIQQALTILREVKRYREDRVFYTLALRMEVDILLHNSRLNYQEAPKKDKLRSLYNEEDRRAFSICDTLLKNFPHSIEPLPNPWYTSLLPLFPTFHDETLKFYSNRVKENRIEVLETILKKIRAELITASAIVMAKRFLSQSKIDLSESTWVASLLLSSVRDVIKRLDSESPVAPQVVSDINLPKGISQGQLEIALQNVEGHIDQANLNMDTRKYTASLLQLGILNFLRNSEANTIRALVNTLRAGEEMDPSYKKIRQYRHDLFPDIPFMIGTSFLRLEMMARQEEREETNGYLEKSISGLLRAVQLNPHYHQAYVNLVLAMHLAVEPGQDEVIRLYLESFEGDVAKLDRHMFRNLAVLEAQSHGSHINAQALKWLILSHFSLGGDLTKGKKVLQDLKTLYLLNAHDLSSKYLDTYRSALRQNDEEFVADLEDNAIHSAILFYIAHAFASRSLIQGRGNKEVLLDHDILDQCIELNTDALYFNSQNNSALRLVETQKSILHFAIKRTEKRWEQINSNLSQRFGYYEDYLREMKSYELLKEKLTGVELGDLVPTLEFSETAALRMDITLTEDQRDRLRNRVKPG